MCAKEDLENTLSPVKDVSFCNCNLHGERLVFKRLVDYMECSQRSREMCPCPLIEGGKYAMPVKRCPKNSS